MASGSKRAAPISRAENIEKWIKQSGGTDGARHHILALVALIEALEVKNHTRYDRLPEKQA